MNKAALRLPTYPRYDLLLSPDPTLVEELAVMQAEFDFRYATGETSDYNGFGLIKLSPMGRRAGRLPPRRRPFADEVSPGSCTVVKYEIIIYWSREDEAFIAEVPELPGCTADGSTYQKISTTYKWSSRSGSRPPSTRQDITEPTRRLIYA